MNKSAMSAGDTTRVAVALLGSLLVACSEAPTGTEDTSGPDPVELIAWQDGDLVTGKVIYHGCGTWYPENVPGGDPVLVDLHFGPEIGGHSPPATDEQVASVTAAGATPVHRFDLPIVRAWVPRELIGEPLLLWYGLTHVRAVVQQDRFDVDVVVSYTGDIAPVTAEFEALEGVVVREWPQVGTFDGVIPDGRIEELRDLSAVRRLTAPSIKCLQGG